MFLFLGCGDKHCYNNFYNDVAGYTFNPNLITQKGISIESSFLVDLLDVDDRVQKITNCVANITLLKPIISHEEQIAWQCLSREMRLPPYDLSCIGVKIMKPVENNCSNWQVLPVSAPDSLCIEKGIIPTNECPCRWRSLIINDSIVITTPVVYLWDVARIITGCNNVWHSPYAACMGEGFGYVSNR